jgi:hypothetical protein
LVKSLSRVSAVTKVELSVAAENRRPLAEFFNEAIGLAAEEDVLVFVHDDVWVDDWQIAARLEEALSRFDVVGVAGNTRRVARQEAWILHGATRTLDLPHLSGAVCHGIPVEGQMQMSGYGPAPREVKLLDGVFLAARAGRLRVAGVRFDPAFSFHFYDADFCRSCETAGLKMGTWPIALLHRSAGSSWASPEWDRAYAAYLDKWKA